MSKSSLIYPIVFILSLSVLPSETLHNVGFKCKLPSLGKLFQFDYVDDFDDVFVRELERAQCVWETIISSRQIDYHEPIYVSLNRINHSNSFLAHTNVNQVVVVDDNNLVMPAYAKIIINDNQFHMLTPPAMFITLLHELTHVLGFGLTWNDIEIYTEGSGMYHGKHALEAYRILYDLPNAISVPVETNFGDKSDDGHWAILDIMDIHGRYLKNEIMVSHLVSPVYLTRLTIESMRDLGYNINPIVCYSDSDCPKGTKCHTRFIDMCYRPKNM